MTQDQTKPPVPNPSQTSKPFTPPLKPNFPGLNQFKTPNFNKKPMMGNNAFRNQNRGSGGK
ncbi:MAG: hypothetical protein WCT01_03990 [Candidatus Shapirobacteria bacterium]